MRIQKEFAKHLSFQQFTQALQAFLCGYTCRLFDTSVLGLTLLGSLVVILSPNAYAIGITGLVSRVGDATHVEFRGKTQWNYDLERLVANQVKVVVPPFDVSTQSLLKTWSGPLIKKVEINKKGKNGNYVITFTLKDSHVESFDYLTDDPSRLIIDFYRLEIPRKKREKTSRKKKKNQPVSQAVSSGSYIKKNKSREPTGSEFLEVPERNAKKTSLSSMARVFDGNDPNYQRFSVKDYEIKEEAIIASRQNIYIRFPILEIPVSELSNLIENSPEYVIRPRSNEENKRARFLMTLYLKNRKASFLKAFDFFIKKYPDTRYDEIIRNMAAEIHFRLFQKTKNLYHFNKAKAGYEYLLVKYPDSPLAERTELFLGYADFERGDAAGALQTFKKFMKTRPGSSEREKVQRALGAAFLSLKKYKDATRVFKELEKNSRDKKLSMEAAYRLGDVAFSQRDYPNAIRLYHQALKQHKEYELVFPNAHYNLAESYFWTGDYRKSLRHHLNFIRLFSAHEHGGYAITRVGELMEIMGVDQSRVMGAFLESYFRFRENPGAGVARVRMLSQRMKGMKKKELKNSVEEMKKIGKESSLPKMDEFVSLMIADGYHYRRDYKSALEFLIGYYRQNPSSSSLRFFYKRILKNITDDLRTSVYNGDFMKVLGTFSKYSVTWLKNADRMDIHYFLGQAYEQAGVFDEAESIYGRLLKGIKRIRGTKEDRERRVNEYLPSFDELHIRLASVSVKQRHYAKAHQYLLQVKIPDQLSPELQVEWVENLAQIAEEKGKTKEAIKHLLVLTKTWKDKPHLLLPIYLRLAEMQIRNKKYAGAEKSLSVLTTMKGNKFEVDEDVWAKAMERRADVLLKQGKSVAAVEAYLEMLEQFEKKRPLSYIRYKVGSILYDKGDLRGAEKIWAHLGGESGQMYRKLADERLAQAGWQDNYKKYINRIPAMSDIKKMSVKKEK